MAASPQSEKMQELADLEKEKDSNLKRAKRYQAIRYWLFLIRYIYTLAILTVLLFAHISFNLKSFAAKFISIPLGVNAIYIFLFFTLLTIALIPLEFYSSFILEHSFNLSNQTLLSWIWDEIKGLVIGIIIFLPLGIAIYALLDHIANFWWIYAAILWIVFGVILAYLAPVLIAPLFNKFDPISDKELRSRIFSLAEKAKLKIKEVLRTDMSRRTKKANAYFTGIGNTKRIVLGDTLMDEYTRDEIETVVAHEMGHWKLKHIWKNIAINSVGSFFAFYLANIFLRLSFSRFNLEGISDIAGLPLLLLTFMLLGLLTMPIRNTLSRYYEHQADIYELKLARKPAATISTFKKLTKQNLSDPSPHPVIEFLLYSHPSTSKRIALAQTFLEKKDF